MPRGDARERIIGAAERLFSEKWYSAVSVADICRSAGVSNGIAYHYFEGKEEIFLRLMDRTIEVVDSSPGLNGSQDPWDRLGNYIGDLLRVTVANKHLIRAFRQGQYRYLDYERKLKGIYERHLAAVLGRPVDEAGYSYVMSGLRFVNIRHAFDGTSADIRTMRRIVEGGIFSGAAAMRPVGFLPRRILPPAVELEQTVRMNLMRSGKELFGRGDFSTVGVADITRRAGTAVGTFYKHFPSKEGCLADILKWISAEMRRFISVNMPPGLTRLEEEVTGLYLFCLYLTFDPDCYPVVRQAEYVVPSAAREYYDGFMRGHLRRMDWLPQGWDAQTTANFLIGIAHYLGLRFAYSKDIKDARQYIEDLMDYFEGGIRRREVL